MGIGRSYVKSEDLAQEISQDTFLKFFDTVGKLNEVTCGHGRQATWGPTTPREA